MGKSLNDEKDLRDKIEKIENFVSMSCINSTKRI